MVDVVDRANADSDFWLDKQLQQIRQTTANDIYECIDCGESIGVKRKQALPSAERCIACQKKYENRSRP